MQTPNYDKTYNSGLLIWILLSVTALFCIKHSEEKTCVLISFNKINRDGIAVFRDSNGETIYKQYHLSYGYNDPSILAMFANNDIGKTYVVTNYNGHWPIFMFSSGILIFTVCYIINTYSYSRQ